MALINVNRNYLEAIPEMSDSDLMAWAAQAMYNEGEAPKVVRDELTNERGFSEGDIDDEYDRFLAMRARRSEDAEVEF